MERKRLPSKYVSPDLCAVTDQCWFRTNLIARVSHIPGHEIRMVSYALWDGGDCRLYEADYVVYILMRLPLISQCLRVH